MANIQKRNDGNISPLNVDFDVTFLNDFEVEIKNDENQADKVIDKIADAFQSAGIVEDLIPNDLEYVVDLTDEMKKGLANGDLVFDKNKEGQIFAQFRNGNKFGKKVPIKEVIEANGLDFSEISFAMQMKSMQMQLENITKTLSEISEDVSEVKHGQMNDRIALFYSGYNLYKEAECIKDTTMKAMVLAQALKALSDGSEQVKIEMQHDVKYLCAGKYKSKKGHNTEEIDKRMMDINMCFEAIHYSTILKAQIYYRQNELNAMKQTFNEYGLFIQNTVRPNAKKLRQFDKNDDLISDSIWEERAKVIGFNNHLQISSEKIKENERELVAEHGDN